MSLPIILIVHALLILFISGILYGFSDFIMRALNKLPAQSAIDAMNCINVSVYKSVFMVLFMSLAPISIGIAIFSVITLGWSGAGIIIAAASCYIVGMFMMTGMGNVPLNEKLKSFSANTYGSSKHAWDQYYVKWTRLNTLRSVFGLLSSVGFIVAAFGLATH